MTESPNPLPSLLPVPTDWCTPVTGAGPGSDMLSVALALGGLGGFNNHVGGVLSASLEGDVHPALISCTSGAVAWTAAYLQAIHAGLPKDQQIAKLRAFRTFPSAFCFAASRSSAAAPASDITG